MAVLKKNNKWLLLIMLAALFLAGASAVAAQDSGSSTDDDDADAVEMVSIPATTFEMGEAADVMLEECDLFRTGCEIGWFSASQPAHTVQVDPFSIDLYEISNQSFLEFINELGAIEEACDDEDCLTLGDSKIELDGDLFVVDEELLTHPVSGVSWFGAGAYCEWRGDRLPTEAEWELAAGWDFENETRLTYPWGDEFDGNITNFCDVNCPESQANDDYDDGYEFTGPVGSYEDGRSPAGLYDVAGNLWEWVSDWYDPAYYDESPEENPAGPDSGDNKVVRGGSWFDTGNFTSTAVRFPAPPDESGDSIGFRCASDEFDESLVTAQKPADSEATEETPEPTEEPTEEPTATVEPTEEPTATVEPTEEPTATVEPTEEPAATAEPTEEPTATAEPTEEPTATAEPTEEPTATAEPTEEPTATAEPTEEPTATAEPTEEPTATEEPTEEPTATAEPTEEPTATEEPEATSEAVEEEEASVAPVSFNCNKYPGEDRGGTYVVGACDWLVKIAGKLGVSYQALIAANPQIKDPDVIHMGEVINVPARNGRPAPAMPMPQQPTKPMPPPATPQPSAPAESAPPPLPPPPPSVPPATPSGSSLRP